VRTGGNGRPELHGGDPAPEHPADPALGCAHGGREAFSGLLWPAAVIRVVPLGRQWSGGMPGGHRRPAHLGLHTTPAATARGVPALPVSHRRAWIQPDVGSIHHTRHRRAGVFILPQTALRLPEPRGLTP